MKRFLIHIVLFIGVSTIVYSGLLITWGELMPKKLRPNLKYKIGGFGFTYTRLQEVKNTKNIDILFLGSSHTYRTFDNRVFSKHGYSSFNLGSMAQSPLQTEVLVKRYLNQLNPKLIIYESYPGNLSRDGIESGIDIITNDYIDGDIIKMGFHQNDLLIYNALIYGIYKDLKGDKKSYKEPLIQEDESYVSGGFVEKELSYYKKQNHPDKNWKENPKQLKAFKRIIDYIKEQKYPVVFIHAPTTKIFYKARKNNLYYDSLISSYGKYFNLNELLNVDDSLHFFDYHHLNVKGAEIASEYVIGLIKDRPEFNSK